MKVLHLISSGGMYGAEAVILNVSRVLEMQGHRSILGVFHNSSRPNLQVHEAAQAAGIESHLIECRGQIDHHVPKRIRNLVTSNSTQVLHAHGYKADIYAYLARRGSGVALVSTCHTWLDNDLMEKAYGIADRAALRSFDGVIAVSAGVRDQLTRSGTDPGKIRVVFNGIDLQRFAAGATRVPALDSHATCTIGVVARLSPEKGHTYFLQAAAQVVKEFPDCRFVMVGEGPERPALEALTDRLHLRSNVEFWGRRQDMPNVYAVLDLQVFSSLQEGLPMALLEGMASHLPVVATAVGEIPTVLENGTAGVIVPPGDVPALADALLHLLRYPAERAALADRAYEQVRTHFSAGRTAEEYLAVYNAALRQGKTSEAVR